MLSDGYLQQPLLFKGLGGSDKDIYVMCRRWKCPKGGGAGLD